MENPLAPERAAIAYALLILVASVISSQVQVSGLWYGRRTYERSRGEMIAMLYEKTLARKIVTSSKSSAQESEANPISELETAPKKGIQRVWERCWNGVCIVFPFLRSTSTGTQKTKTEEPASMGKILNLMRNDVYEISQRFWEFQGLVEKPLGLVLSIVLIWRLIGWPCLIGIVTVFIAQSLNALLAKVLMKWEVTKRAATDAKLKKVSQFVESIRHLRWYGWQDAWCTDIMDARQEELHLQIICSIWRILIEFTNIFASGMFPVAAFWAYSGLAGMPLRIDIAFPALQLFRKLEESLKEIPSLITVMLNARVAMGRIESFMAEPDISENETSDNSTNRQAGSAGLLNNSNGNRTTDDESRSITNDDGRIEADQADNVVEKLELKHASFSWPAGPPVLHDVTISFPPGLTIVFGEVAAGKSALLQALLGELDRNAGELHRPTGMVGYCAQTPWLQSMSIRENILFGAPYDNQRYKAVIEACALANDLVNFKHGDLSNIGENGIGLSGGQRARVALARAVYSQAEILLLDDPISALDHQTAEFIIQRCLGGNLVKSRTVVLVTHRVELCRHIATQAVEVDHGKAYVVDFAKAIAIHGHDGSSSEEDEEAQESEEQDKTDAAVPEKFIDEEHRASGGVQARVYWEYIKAGKIKFWFILVILLASFRLVSIGETWFLKQWGEAYDTLKIEVKSHGPFSDLPPPEENINPWLLGFTLIAIAKAVTFLIASAFMLVIVYSAGKSMFEKVMARVSHATFRFYDTTPVGRLMNRLTSDITTIDGNISETFQTVAAGAISWISGLIVIASVTPAFLVFSIIVTLAFAFTFRRFLPSSQSLRRLEMVSLSPLMSNFGALVEGLMTVRAFHAQHRFQERVIEVVDNFQKMDHYYWSLQSWFMYRINLIADFAMLIITLIAIYTNVSPGLTAFVLIAAQSLVGATFGLCRSYGKLQMDFVSVERVYEMMILDQEPLGSVDPPAWWPTLTGDIIFDKATLRYAPHLDPSLSDLSFRIKAGSNTAIVGRTGSGKSTLAMALLGTVLPDSGRILIDNIDIASVEKQALRHRVTFVAQDPVLFPGSMRQNLDPLDEYTDEECEAVLKKIAGKHGWTLTTEVDAGGKNLSQGQRQLIGLARTLLRRSPIVILDEVSFLPPPRPFPPTLKLISLSQATASIDLATSLAIQEVLHSEMRESTIITIAHRLEAVKYADYCIELGKGKLLRMGTRDEILGNVG
ncbi:putative abc transporter [Phaeomoniella chlamydospora]|uniref:Putative abc transporter n=1 Tax=Phaeomoniella chlamydospora TaxID=158046 RepID=A0A0G2E7C8_PHACM|nr:putative abc transporter [Phaeomoniella chlamydospora]